MKVIPTRAFLYLTNRCNQNCLHCYLESGPDEKHKMTTSDIKSIIVDMLDSGISKINFDGGEVFLREDIFKLIESVDQSETQLSIVTNASLLDEHIIHQLMGKVQTLSFSLDGAGAETHDWLRNSPGSFNKTIDTIKKVSKHFNINIWFVTNKRNYLETLELPQILINKEIHPHLLCYFLPSKTGRAAKNWEKIGLNQREWNTHLKNMRFLTKKYEWIAYEYWSVPKQTVHKRSRFKTCNVYRREMAYIKSDGTVYFCSLLMNDERFKLGDLKKEKFLKIWTDEKRWNRMKNQIEILTESCSHCDNFDICQRGCIACYDAALKKDYRCAEGVIPLCLQAFYTFPLD